MSAFFQLRGLGIILLMAGVFTHLQAQENEEVSLTVPEVFFAVEGVETGVVLPTFVKFAEDEDLRFEVDCAAGESDGYRWRINARAEEVGDHSFTLRVRSAEGRLLDQEDFRVKVVPADAGNDQEFSLLIMGDSLTNASRYPNTIAGLLRKEGGPRFHLMGTHHPASADPDVFHEGYGGWSWERFCTRFTPEENQVGKTRTSPFVFPNPDKGEPELSVARYFQEYHAGEAPDFVTVLLGINDCFHADPEDAQAIEERIDRMMGYAETFLVQLRKAAPETKIGICLTPAPNVRDGAFTANYKGRYARKGWRTIQYRLVQRQLEAFSGREGENIFVIPTANTVDPMEGYPEDNAVHPNDAGYRDLGVVIYAWLKAMAE